MEGKDDAGRGEGYDKPKDNVPRAECSQSCASSNKQWKKSGYLLSRLCPLHLDLLYPCTNCHIWQPDQ